jgi:hypothetical protein
MAQAPGVSKTDMRRLGELMSAVALALSVAACGGGGGGSSTPATSPTPAAATPTPSPSPAPATTPTPAPTPVASTAVSFTGTVVDSSGAAVSGAVVTVNGTSSAGATTTHTATTSSSGSYTLTATVSEVTSSNVVVSIAKDGYQTTTLTYASTGSSAAVSGGTTYSASSGTASTSTTSTGSVVLAPVVVTDPLVLAVEATTPAVVHLGDGEAATGAVNVFQSALYGPSYTVALGTPSQLSTYLKVTVAAASLQSALCPNTMTVFQSTSATGTRLHAITSAFGSADFTDSAYHDVVVTYDVSAAGFTLTDGKLYAQITAGNCQYPDSATVTRLDDFEFTNVRAKFSATN